MLGLEMLDVAIGVIFVYLLLSLICSSVNEIIESFLKKRADYLERGIKELLRGMTVGKSDANVVTSPDVAITSPPQGNNEKATADDSLTATIYTHPLIAGLYDGNYSELPSSDSNSSLIPVIGAARRRKLPSYIPARNFALAFMDTVFPETIESPGTNKSLQQIRDSINSIPNEQLRKTLLPLINAAEGDINKLRANIEAWYNSSMDRVAGWYKRRAQTIILILGLIVAVYINADTITIVKRLSNDRATRDSLVAASQEYVKADVARNSAAPNPSPTVAPSPTATPEACQKEENSTKCICAKDANSPECKLKTNYDKIQSLGLPVGWHRFEDEKSRFLGISLFKFSPYFPEDFSGRNEDPSALLKILGWLMTAAAISLGAPFWFDLLNKFMVVRSTVKPKEKSPDEPSKDR